MSAPSNTEIQAEIDLLKQLKPTVRKESFFGDNHHDAIDAQIKVLSERMSEEDTETEYEYEPENVKSSALEAFDWMEDSAQARPSDGWQELVTK